MSRSAALAAIVPKVAIWLTAVATVFLLHVVDDAVAVRLAEVDVEVRHRDALGIEEALEQQLVLERIEPGDVERIGDQRAGARAAARADRATVGAGPVDEVGDDEEVAGKAHREDGLDLELQPLDIAGPLLLPPRRVRIALAQPDLETVVRSDPEVLGHRHAPAIDHRRVEVGQLGLAEHEVEAAAPARSRHCWRARSAGRRRAPPSRPATSGIARG